jgi:MerR family transcriptional regulator/heat shock protein HspR
MKRRPAEEDFKFDMDEPVFTTGVVTRLLGIPVWVLKQLDREEVVCPPRRGEGCSRLYSKREMVVLKKVWHYMKVKKLKVQGVKVVMEIEQEALTVRKRR